MTTTDPRWRLDAACLGQDLSLFFSDGDSSRAQTNAREAKALCAGCPVAAQCLADAHETRDEHGVRGGLTGRERKDSRPARIAECGTRSGYLRHRKVLKEDACTPCKKANTAYTVAMDKRWPKTRTA